MIDESLRMMRPSRRLPWLACWPVVCCLALNGCASNAPQTANEPSSYPPWVCGLSHNKDRWQCQREGEEPSAGEREGATLADGQPAPSATPSAAEVREPASVNTAQADPATGPATVVAKPATAQPEPALADSEPEAADPKPDPSPPSTELPPDEDNDAPLAAAGELADSNNEAPAPAPQVSSSEWSPRSASTGRADEESLQPGSARGHPSHEKSLQPGSARGMPSHEGSQLMDLPPDYFAIQAGAFPNPEALHQHITQYGIEPAYRVRLASNDRLFHVLILQIHDSRRAAEAAVANLPQPLNSLDLWIRSVGSLQNAVRAGDALADGRHAP